MTSRPRGAAERMFAYRVFGDSVRYDAVSIGDTAIERQVITTHFGQMQDKLVAPGYPAPPQADGSVGRSNSATLDAVRLFQSRNGLKPDRDPGGPNSETRKAPLRPANTLRGLR